MSSTKWLLLMPLAAIAGAVGAPSLADANDDDIVIGFATSRSGFMAQYDDNPTKMAQVFIDEANAKGGLLGRKAEGRVCGREVGSCGRSEGGAGSRPSRPRTGVWQLRLRLGSPGCSKRRRPARFRSIFVRRIRRRASQDPMLSPLLPSPRRRASPWPIGRLTKRVFVRRTCSWTTPASTTNRFAAALIGSFP